MTSRKRLLTALAREVPDRLPVTVHQWQPYHLNRYLGGIGDLEAFCRLGMDAAVSVFDAYEEQETTTPQWQVEVRHLYGRGEDGRRVIEYTVTTPEGVLNRRDEGNDQTTWIVEPLVKRPEDVLLIKKYLPVPRLNREAVHARRAELGDDGILRGFVFGDQAGPWQHACCLYGTERMIFATFDDPGWVHEFLRTLTDKKLRFIEESLDAVPFDLIETGGGAASSTVISPRIFETFCLPYDWELHDALHAVGHKVAYHTCGGMMPILELIVQNGCDASETLSPPGMGGDAVHEEIKRRIGDQVCLIGGMDQFNVLAAGTPGEIRREVRRLFDTLGPGGGYIMSPCDHFFETPVENLRVYADAARECVYA